MMGLTIGTQIGAAQVLGKRGRARYGVGLWRFMVAGVCVVFASSELRAQQDDASESSILGEYFGIVARGYLAPIQWRGSLAQELTRRNFEGGSSQVSRQSLGLSGRTYVTHPAILSLDGTMTLARADTEIKPAGEESVYTAAAGRINLGGLSRTPYPYSLSYQVSDSTSEGIVAREDFRRHDWRYEQEYRPAGELYSARATLARARTDGASGLRTDSGDYGIAYTTGFGEGHALRVNTTYQHAETSQGAENGTLSAFLTHDFNLEYYYRVSNTLRHSELTTRSGSGAPEQRGQNGQYFNSVMWIPSDDYPLTLTSGITVDWFEQPGAAATQAYGVMLSADYRFSDRMSALVSGNLQRRESDLETGRNGSVNASLTYRGQTRQWRDYQHSWGGNAFASRASFDGGASDAVALTANQSLYRTFIDDEGRSWSASGNQAIGVTRAAAVRGGVEDPNSQRSLTHSVSLGFSATDEEGRSFSTTGSVQDSRNWSDDGGDSVLQTVSGSANGALALSRSAGLSAAISIAISRLDRGGGAPAGAGGWTTLGSGFVSYQHQRPFRLPRTTYSANFRIDARNNTQLGTSVGDNYYLYAYAFDHGIENRIGLLSTSLRQDVSWGDAGGLVWGLRFRVARAF